MATKLSDSELANHTRAANRRRGERHRERLTLAGKSALTIWIPTALRSALTAAANEQGATVGDIATAWLVTAAALATRPGEPETVKPPTPPVDRIERDRLILELHRQGLKNPEIGRRFNTSEGSIRRALKRMAELSTG